MRQLFANRYRVPLDQVVEYQPFGAVVGLKSGGEWTFYLHKCGSFEYLPKPGAPALGAYMVLEVRECWPGGGGVFRSI